MPLGFETPSDRTSSPPRVVGFAQWVCQEKNNRKERIGLGILELPGDILRSRLKAQFSLNRISSFLEAATMPDYNERGVVDPWCLTSFERTKNMLLVCKFHPSCSDSSLLIGGFTASAPL